MHDGACSHQQPLPVEEKRWEGLRPVFFGPCTPHGTPGQVGRTWGTRPGKRAALVDQGSSAHSFIASVATHLISKSRVFENEFFGGL
jgi:hypothetical protein